MESLIASSKPLLIGVIYVVLVIGASVMTGQALARAWRPAWQVLFACFGLVLTDRYLAWALFDGALDSALGLAVDAAAITAIGMTAYRLAHVAKMVEQYPWLYERATPWSYRPLG